MSKPERKKVVVTLDSAPILEDLGFQDLVSDYRAKHAKEKAASDEADKWKAKKDTISAEIIAAIQAVKADIVEFSTKTQAFRTTLVASEPGSKLDEDKLQLNLMKIGKLDAETVSKILKASQVPVAARKPHIIVTPITT